MSEKLPDNMDHRSSSVIKIEKDDIANVVFFLFFLTFTEEPGGGKSAQKRSFTITFARLFVL